MKIYRAQRRNVEKVAYSYWGELARYSYWCYDYINPLLFGDNITTPLFQFCQVMPYGKHIGQAHTYDLDRPVIDIFLSLWTKPWDWKNKHTWVFGLIAHELLHFQVGRMWRKAGKGWVVTSHENEFWMGDAARIYNDHDEILRRCERRYYR